MRREELGLGQGQEGSQSLGLLKPYHDLNLEPLCSCLCAGGDREHRSLGLPVFRSIRKTAVVLSGSQRHKSVPQAATNTESFSWKVLLVATDSCV